MIHRVLLIGRWTVDFLFSVGKYDVDGVLACLYDAGAPRHIMDDAEDLMLNCEHDCGFTFSKRNEYTFINPALHRAVVLIGPASSGAEFLDTFVHEIHHLAVAIASELGVDLEGEIPAYIAGDAARSLAQIVCELGCERCKQ